MINVYLKFPGTCAPALAFYAKTFRGEIESSMKHGDSPMKEHVGPDWHDKIVHAALRIGDSVLMATDMPPQMYKVPQGFSVSITTTAAEAERVFPLLAEGGTVNMPLTQTFWAERFGDVVDRFGIPWMITGGLQPQP